MEIVLFRYRSGNSVMHKVPSLFKIVFLILFSVVTFADGTDITLNEIVNISVLIKTAITLIVSIVLFFFSDTKLTSLRCLKSVLILGIAVTFFRMLYFPTDQQLLVKNSIMMSDFFGINIDGLISGVLYTAKFFTTTLVAQIVFETTSSLQITESMESVQNAIAKIFPPIGKINPVVVVSLAINFIPLIFDTWNRVHFASLARSGSKKKNILQSIQITGNELEALLSCLLYKAEIKRQAMVNRSCNE